MEERKSERIQKNPISIARRYLQEREGETGKTYAKIAEVFGVSRAEVCYHIGLINRLPGDFVQWLEQCNDQNVLRVFTERRLRPITRLDDPVVQLQKLRELAPLTKSVRPFQD